MRGSFHEDEHERGAALLSVLLLVAIMSIAALALFESTVGAIAHARLADARARIAWQISGAEEAGLIGLQRLSLATNGVVTDRTPVLGVPFVTDINGVQVSTVLEDSSNCFNLNALRAPEGDGSPDESLVALYETLLTGAGLLEQEAEFLTSALLDWLDRDTNTRPGGAETNYYASLRPSYRASGVLLVSESELRAVRGYTSDILDVLLPLICVRADSEMAVLNINTLTRAQAPLLSMVFSGVLDVDEATRVLAERPVGGWSFVEEMLEKDELARISPALRRLDLISVQSSHFRLRGRVIAQDQSADFETHYIVTQNQPPRMTRRLYGAR